MRFVFPVVLKGCRDDSQRCVLIAVLLGAFLIDVSSPLLVCSCVSILKQVPLDISRSVRKIMKVIEQKKKHRSLVIITVILFLKMVIAFFWGHCFHCQQWAFGCNKSEST